MDRKVELTPDSKPDNSQPENNQSEALSSRRDLARKLGRFAAYAAPITMLLVTDKAKACVGSLC